MAKQTTIVVIGSFRIKPALGGVCSLANYSVAYEETQSNRVFDFRDFVFSLLPKAIHFDSHVCDPLHEAGLLVNQRISSSLEQSLSF